MVDRSKYKHVTYSQIDKMKHAIGFNYGEIKGIKHRKYEPYRNFYASQENGDPELDELVTLGFMRKSSANDYHVTDDGKTFLELVTGVEILSDME